MSDDRRLTEELVTDAEAGAVEVVAADAAERLACVCAGWPADRFRSLVLDVARVRLRHGVPRAQFEALRRDGEIRQRAAHRAAITPPPAALTQARRFPASPGPSASAPP
jgi:hypothetical protein